MGMTQELCLVVVGPLEILQAVIESYVNTSLNVYTFFIFVYVIATNACAFVRLALSHPATHPSCLQHPLNNTVVSLRPSQKVHACPIMPS